MRENITITLHSATYLPFMQISLYSLPLRPHPSIILNNCCIKTGKRLTYLKLVFHLLKVGTYRWISHWKCIVNLSYSISVINQILRLSENGRSLADCYFKLCRPVFNSASELFNSLLQCRMDGSGTKLLDWLKLKLAKVDQ